MIEIREILLAVAAGDGFARGGPAVGHRPQDADWADYADRGVTVLVDGVIGVEWRIIPALRSGWFRV